LTVVFSFSLYVALQT